jgi:hypothetical protein
MRAVQLETQQDPAGLVRSYLDGFYSGDHESAGRVLADGFSFSGPFVTVQGRDAFLASAEGLRRIAKGHRLLHQWADGSDVCSVYEVRLETPIGAGEITMFEWHKVEGDRLVSGRVAFDSVPFRALLPTAPTH